MGVINKLDIKDAGDVSGGLTLDYGSENARPYEVIDDISGEVVVRCSSMVEAKNYAKLHNYSTAKVSWSDLKALRAQAD